MIKGEIKTGICGFQATVEARSEDGMTVELAIQSDCPRVRALAAELTSMDAFQEIFKPLNKTEVLELAARHKLHTACVVPVGILKCVEAAAHLALPATSVIALTQEEG
jgi:hypothetical protein